MSMELGAQWEKQVPCERPKRRNSSWGPDAMKGGYLECSPQQSVSC